MAKKSIGETMLKETLEVFSDPAKIVKLTKEQLIELYEITLQLAEDLDAQTKAIKDALTEKIETNGEIIGDYSVVKAKRVNFRVDLEKAEELGATKKAVDNTALKRLYDSGVEIPHTITEYLLIKPVTRSKQVEN